MSKNKADRTSLSKNQSSFNSSIKLKQDDLIKLKQAKELLFSLKEKYNLTSDELKNLIESELWIPISIFNNKLTVLESVVKYLKEDKNISLHEISRVINRDERNIWHTYASVKKKYPEKLILENVKFWIPVSIFSDSKLSALETLVSHLKEKLNFSYHEIAVLLSRNDRTIWTVYSRARKKYVK